MRQAEGRSAVRWLTSLSIVWILLWSGVAMIAVQGGQGADVPENMPIVPPEEAQLVCPYSVMSAHSLQWGNYSGEVLALYDWYSHFPAPGNANFTGMRFALPYPNSTGVTVLEDKLWINELTGLNLHDILDPSYPDLYIAPIVVLDTATMSHNDSELFHYLLRGLNDWSNNLTIDHSWFPSYLLDFRIYGSAYINLETLGATDVTVMGLYVSNCSRETYWQQNSQFFYSYYTTQKKYEATLQLENNISTSHYYDVRWYVGFPANRTVDPSTLRIYDLDNALYLTLGENYDASNGGVWMSFARLDMGVTRSFTFDIWGWNASIGLGMAIAYTDAYASSSLGSVDYFKSSPTWTNNYGRIYTGAVLIQLNLDSGVQKDIDPSDIHIYDKVNGVYLEPWEYAISGGLIIVNYAIVPVGSVQSYEVYFKLDLSQNNGFNILSTAFMAGSFAVSWLVLMFIASGVLALIYWGTKLKIIGYSSAMVFAFALILYYFSQTAGGI